jgi:hypothetical protein
MKYIAISLLILSLAVIAKEAPAPNYLTDEMLDGYVGGLRKQLPITSPDGIKIISLSRQGRTLIYGMSTPSWLTQEKSDYLSSITKKIICNQDAEKFMLTRGVNLTWNHFNKEGKYLATTTLTPADCGYK